MSSIGTIAAAFKKFSVEVAGYVRTKTRVSYASVVGHYLHGLVQAEERTLAEMSRSVEGADAQRLQHFMSNSKWSTQALWGFIAERVNSLLGGEESSLALDETCVEKKGCLSVGVARQWLGRLGKTDNGQVFVCASLCSGSGATFVDAELYLPQEWVDDPSRCERAGIPKDCRKFRSKADIAVDLVRRGLRRGLRFGWVLADAGYGKEPQFLRDIDAMGLKFVVDVRSNQRVWLRKPDMEPPRLTKKGNLIPARQTEADKAQSAPMTVGELARKLQPHQWERTVLREGSRGPIEVEIAHLRIWVSSSTDEEPRNWHLIMRREVEQAPRTTASPRRKKTKRQRDKEKKLAREAREKEMAERKAAREAETARKKQEREEQKAAKELRKAEEKTHGKRKDTHQAVAVQTVCDAQSAPAASVPQAAQQPPPEAASPVVDAAATPPQQDAQQATDEEPDCKVKFSLSNAPAETPTLVLARQQGGRYAIERNNQDAKTDTGLADYRMVGWVAWGHHVVLVVAAMLFMLMMKLKGTNIENLMSFGDVVLILKKVLERPLLNAREIADTVEKRIKNRDASKASHTKHTLKARAPPVPDG